MRSYPWRRAGGATVTHDFGELVKAISSGRFWPVDRTGGDLTENPVHYDVPADLDAIWAQQAEQRRERELAGAPEFRDRPAEHPHVHA